MAASIEYLSPEFPDMAAFLLERVGLVEEIFQEKVLRRASTVEGKAKALAYILSGLEAGYEGKQYALRQVRTAIYRQRKSRNTKI